MSLAKFEGDAALDALADLIEPAAVTFGDPQMGALVKSGHMLEAIKYAIRNHKREVTEILAILDGKDPMTYKPRLLTAPIKLLEILNDSEIQTLFFSPQKTEDQTTSGSVLESIKGEKE